jgi:hypothetical protein
MQGKPSEQALIDAAQSGDKAAFDVLVHRYEGYLR